MKITLDVPDAIHIEVKEEQLSLQKQGQKVNLRELYYDIISAGLEARKQKKAAKSAV